jgi:hypothetical protein
MTFPFRFSGYEPPEISHDTRRYTCRVATERPTWKDQGFRMLRFWNNEVLNNRRRSWIQSWPALQLYISVGTPRCGLPRFPTSGEGKKDY